LQTRHRAGDARVFAVPFEVGKEVLTYRSIREAAAMIRKTHRDLTRLKQIGVAGRRRVLSEHTWATRLDQLAELL